MSLNINLPEAQRGLGSEWLKNHPQALSAVYDFSKRVFFAVYPLLKRVAPRFSEQVITWGEARVKGWMFNCQMCGQCVLHSTGMTCPMTCPKNLRNGPCGGVRANGHCEVIPQRMCVWVQAWERSQRMTTYAHEMRLIQPPVNRALHNTSSWINMYEKIDMQTPPGWEIDAPPKAH
ncbi:MAG: methylenetetrahydrofolate reductase C-terminal domain-containing protein [Chloroflexi bacterium]|nr:methylenetetrahydrofolate reductase C-terminal domain-containing protein [Chloroflexota bacterium]